MFFDTSFGRNGVGWADFVSYRYRPMWIVVLRAINTVVNLQNQITVYSGYNKSDYRNICSIKRRIV
jgi:hypothetical protein